MSKNKTLSSNPKVEEIKEKQIEEQETSSEDNTAANKMYGHLMARIAMWIIFFAIVAGLWIKPEILQQIISRFEMPQQTNAAGAPSIKQLEKQIYGLQTQIRNLQRTTSSGNFDTESIKALNNRISNFEKQNIALIETKADKESLMGIINRLDRIEERLNNMAKISDQGALILSAVMMIKDSAEKGNSFEYEAEMLSQLTAQETQMQNSVRIINSYAQRKIPSKQELQENFTQVREVVEKAEQEREIKDKNWKERLNMKFQEVVQIKHTNQQENETAQPDLLSAAQKEVDTGHFAQAITLLNASPELISQNPILQEWISSAQTHISFNQAISQLSSSSLALMKLNYVQTKAAN